MSNVIEKTVCPGCRAKGGDTSGDNLIVYDNGGRFCFVCDKAYSLSDTYKHLNKNYFKMEIDFPVTNYTREDWERDKVQYTTDPRGFRGLKKSTCDTYKVHHLIDETTGEVLKQFYPVTKDKNFSGIKVRRNTTPKTFYADGYNKTDCELFGQALFRNSSSRWVVITSGELDALSAYQILNSEEGLLKKDRETGDYAYPVIPVVSGTTGEASSLKQYQNNYDFLNRFETVYLIPDQDEAGEAALHKVATCLPKNKLKIINLPAKDVNKLLEDGRGKDLISAFWKAKFYSPAGILGSDTIYDKMLEKALTPKIEFPPDFLSKLNDVTGGGLPIGSIVNITAGCYPANTEFFNGTEWKLISDYQKGDLVLQYDKDTNQSTLSEPLEYVVLPTDQFYEISNKRVSFTTSASHKHLVKTENNVLKTVTTLELLSNHNNKTRGNRVSLLNTFEYSGSGIDISEKYLRLKIAVFADGSFKTDSQSTKVSISVKKEGKEDRLRYLLAINKIKYKKSVKATGYSVFSFKMDNRDKHFPDSWYNASKEQFEIIKDEVVKWNDSLFDSSENNRKDSWTYTTLNKKDSDFIQFVLTSLNFSASIYTDCREKYRNDTNTAYTVRLNSSQGYGISKDLTKENTTEIKPICSSENMYCFTTNTGFFVVRQNNQIFVSGNSGSGKSTFVNEFVLYHLLKKDFGIGVVSLEADAGDYGENLLGAYIREKLQLIKSPEEKYAYLKSDAIKNSAAEIFLNEDGTPSFHLIDERGDYDILQEKIEELIITCNTQIIIIDVLSDVFDGLPMDAQAKWMSWQKQTCKRYGVTFINVVHTRKVGSGQKAASTGAVMTEEDIAGSGTQYKSASLNIILSRNKTAEDENMRNLVQVHIAKNRQTGWTGLACNLYYDMASHKLHDADLWFKQNNIDIINNGLNPSKEKDVALNRF